jgi:hypothetical protein
MRLSSLLLTTTVVGDAQTKNLEDIYHQVSAGISTLADGEIDLYSLALQSETPGELLEKTASELADHPNLQRRSKKKPKDKEDVDPDAEPAKKDDKKDDPAVDPDTPVDDGDAGDEDDEDVDGDIVVPDDIDPDEDSQDHDEDQDSGDEEGDDTDPTDPTDPDDDNISCDPEAEDY